MVVNYVYEMIVTHEEDEQGNAYTGYGIEVWVNFGTEQTRLHRIPDIFTSQNLCERLVRLCNTEEVAPIHLLEIIDNVLAE